jgi:hypothetical protein
LALALAVKLALVGKFVFMDFGVEFYNAYRHAFLRFTNRLV